MTGRKKWVGAGVGYAVAGPAGALVGIVAAGSDDDDRGYNMSDIPVGVHVEAEWEDDAVGRRWGLRFLSEVPARGYATLRLLNDAGQNLPGREPFADEGGGFAAAGVIHAASCAVYVPFGAAIYASRKHISLEITVWDGGKGKGRPVGKATLDAKLPKPRELSVASYLQPMLSLCARVMTAGGAPNREALENMVGVLAHELGFSSDVEAKGHTRAMLEHALDPLPADDATRVLFFRSPGIVPAAHVELLRLASFGQEQPSSVQQGEVTRIESLLLAGPR